MKDEQKENFVMVNYDLLATTKLSSTQKLFVSYIIGWQNNGKICFETNKNLALRFGLKYGGIRSVIAKLNKLDFFNSEIKNFDDVSSTSGHEITVDINKLEVFLASETMIKKIDSTDGKFDNEPNQEEHELESLPKYLDEDTVDIEVVMSLLDFTTSDIQEFQRHFKSTKVRFEDLQYYFYGITLTQKMEFYKGVLISDEQKEKFNKMIAD